MSIEISLHECTQKFSAEVNKKRWAFLFMCMYVCECAWLDVCMKVIIIMVDNALLHSFCTHTKKRNLTVLLAYIIIIIIIIIWIGLAFRAAQCYMEKLGIFTLPYHHITPPQKVLYNSSLLCLLTLVIHWHHHNCNFHSSTWEHQTLLQKPSSSINARLNWIKKENHQTETWNSQEKLWKGKE